MLRRVMLTAVLIMGLAACGGDGTGETTTTAPENTSSTLDPAPAPTTTSGARNQDEPPELADTTWLVTHHASEIYGGVTNVWPDTEITLAFGADGAISGNAGCNDYTGTYMQSGPYITDPAFDEEEGQQISVSGLSWTERACESDNVMEQEAEFLDALQRAQYWLIGQGLGGDSDLLLRSDEDGLLIEAARAD